MGQRFEAIKIDQFGEVISVAFAIFGEPRSGVLDDADQVESDQIVSGRTTRTSFKSVGDLLGRVRALATGTKLHQLFEFGRIAGNPRIEPGIGIRTDIDDRSHLGFGLAKDFLGTLLRISLIEELAMAMCRSFDGTGEVDAPSGIGAVTAHG